ncbi:MAG: exo-alpha-sialidase, partial [Candidatus Hydrogenedentes bacterium]|nr:exo-alpha-sialidase [Candidatus Hydrogenedentota bacterium]
CIVECPNGDLRAVWYENAPPFPTEQRDRSSDVRIGGARKRAGKDTWDAPFVIADTQGRSDNNPCMVIDSENRLWLFHATLDYPPRNTWVYATVKYMVSSDYESADVPVWLKSAIFEPKFEGLEEIVTGISVEDSVKDGISAEELVIAREKIKKPETLREGWMTRAHPLIRSDGTLLLPLASEHYEIAAMAMTKNGGESWTFSAPVPDTGVEQPSVVEFPGGRMLAYLRTLGVEHSIEQTESLDGGMTWSPTTVTGLLHPCSGIEAIVLRSGRLALVYNDKYDDPRDSLAISLSEDEGKTWRWTRHLENTPGERFDYPSLIQAKDDSLHVTYSHNTEAIKHVRFNETWVMQGDR